MAISVTGTDRSWLAGPAGVFLAATVLTTLMAAPVLRHPTFRLFGDEIVGRHHDPYTVIHQFEHPQALGMYSQPATDWVGAGIAWLVGDGVLAYNLIVLGSFPLAALTAYLLAFHLTASAAASWLAALFFAFAPYHVAHAAYHPHTAQTQWLPLYLLALLRCVDRASPGRLALLVAATAVVTLSSFYYGLVAAVLTPVALLAYWPLASRRRNAPCGRNVALTAGTLVLVAGLALGYVLRWAPSVLRDPAAVAWPLEELFRYSARWWSYLLPPIEHPVFGGWVRAFWEWHGREGLLEQQLTLGVGLLLLAGLAVTSWLRGRRRPGLDAVPWLVLVAVTALLLSFSPEWRLGEMSFPRPSSLLYEAAPMFRAYARFGVVVALAVAVLGGLGFAARDPRPRRAALVSAALLALAVLELTPVPPWRWRDVLPTAAHRWLAAQPPPVSVFDCAPASDPGERTLYHLFPHPIRLAGPQDDCGQPGFAARAGAFGATHLLVRRASQLGGWLSEAPTPPGLRPVGGFADALLFSVEASPQPLSLAVGDGFHWREYKGNRTYRWMGDRGTLMIDVAPGRSLEATLELTLHAFPQARILDVELDGSSVGELRVGSEPAALDVGPLELIPGRHELALLPREPAVVADDLLHNGDERALTVALWDWRWRLRPARPDE